jgi:hypothetical protein
MYPRVQDVEPNPNYTLTLTFANGEVKVFDVNPGSFSSLRPLSPINLSFALWHDRIALNRTTDWQDRRI